MKRKIITVVSTLFGLMFVNEGLSKFFNYTPVPEDIPYRLTRLINSIAENDWLWLFFGAMEIVSGILFMTNKFRALGAIIIFPMMIGILITHILADHNTLPEVIVLMAINLWAIWENREKYLPMIR